MNRNSSNSVILQQKIIHLQSELSKYKSIQKEKLLLENQYLKEQISNLRSENELLKQQFVSSNIEEATEKRSAEPIKKMEEKRANKEAVVLENGWFFHNLIHEKKKK
ncbi:hypothetical protein RGU12_05350 [Fredinandcohnia sp. QZ13]|uniref:hypothetical protein n=1 Tax=Fredinandcohnia sp. QZ13 TaxID=3073144 RepID=UPI0028532DA5|nr:hypothetical protein [Fredinandcohnia sp. QZ13]MDR4886978.1 hypothetical protein [Fredinandcohnia sp. QZ13]